MHFIYTVYIGFLCSETLSSIKAVIIWNRRIVWLGNVLFLGRQPWTSTNMNWLKDTRAKWYLRSSLAKSSTCFHHGQCRSLQGEPQLMTDILVLIFLENQNVFLAYTAFYKKNQWKEVRFVFFFVFSNVSPNRLPILSPIKINIKSMWRRWNSLCIRWKEKIYRLRRTYQSSLSPYQISFLSLRFLVWVLGIIIFISRVCFREWN